MRVPAVALVLLALTPSVHAATGDAPRPRGPAWQPSSGHRQIALWPAAYPLARPEVDGPEATVTGSAMVAGRPWTAVINVTVPTMTVYAPRGRNSGAAIMVFPGGGYQALAIDLEGEEICDWITAKGMSCVVLKYRVPQNWHRNPDHEQPPAVQMGLQDAQRAMGLLRQRAGALGIDPHRIGVIGFSAGGHIVAALSNAQGRSYAPVDAADQISSRPDFAIALYPGHLWSEDMPADKVALAPWNRVSADAPPTFLLQSALDGVDDVRNAMFYALALGDAGVPVELHLYPGKAHAFGLRSGANPIATLWPAQVERWLKGIGVL
jgi:acetyl esterase/lipase